MTEKKNKNPFYLIDTDAEFYRPFGTRLTICIAVVAWAAMEIYGGNGFWIVLTGALAVYCVNVLFISYKPPAGQAPAVRPDDPDDGEGGDDPADQAAGRPDDESKP